MGLTNFGLQVRTELLRRGLDMTWLAKEAQQMTGLYVDRSYLYKIFTGTRKAPKITRAICKLLNIDSNTLNVR